jgi:hypothetical protein
MSLYLFRKGCLQPWWGMSQKPHPRKFDHMTQCFKHHPRWAS